MAIYGQEVTLHLIRVATTSFLSQLDVSSYTDGTLAYVSANKQYYSRQSLVRADGVTSFAAANGPGAWVPTFTVATS